MAHILVIEDEAPIRSNLRRFLEILGHQVFEAPNGRVGIEVATRELPALILCDLMMPELDGFGVLQALRAQPATAEIPLIFLTASAEKETIARGIELGALAYVTKPFTLQGLRDALTQGLRPN